MTTKPTINRSTRIVESATTKGYTPVTDPDATICIELLAKGITAIGWPDKGSIEYTRLQIVCVQHGTTIAELSNIAHWLSTDPGNCVFCGHTPALCTCGHDTEE